MKSELGDKERLNHMKESVMMIEDFTYGVDYDTYMKDIKLRLALVKLVENLGEAAVVITNDTEKEFDEVEWRMLKIVRNILIHEYFGISYDVIWKAIQEDIPPLKIKIQHILDTKFPEQQ